MKKIDITVPALSLQYMLPYKSTSIYIQGACTLTQYLCPTDLFLSKTDSQRTV